MTSESSDPQRTMPIETTCRGCQRTLSVTADVFYRTYRCPHCGLEQSVTEAHTPPVATSPRSAAPPVVLSGTPAGSAHFEPILPEEDAELPEVGVVAAAPLHSTPPDGLSVQRSLTAGTQQTRARQVFDRMVQEIGKLFVGQDELVLGSLVALFSSGHVLVESVPGLGKTLFVRTLGRVLGCRFGRIQFTADLMPSDITGIRCWI